ncbi:hypothetical protein DFH09DRAFT_1093177 [Mycena vulgaris]|nr:hypothetical protein DFH09DRAFT_1093177 [Mycena vulgaris]
MEGCRRPKEAVMLRCSGAGAAPANRRRLRTSEKCREQALRAPGAFSRETGWGQWLGTGTEEWARGDADKSLSGQKAGNSCRGKEQGVGRAHEELPSVKSFQGKKTVRIGKRKRKLGEIDNRLLEPRSGAACGVRWVHRRIGTSEASPPSHVYEENRAKVLTHWHADEGGILRHNNQISDLWLKNDSRPGFHGRTSAPTSETRASNKACDEFERNCGRIQSFHIESLRTQGKGIECVGELEKTAHALAPRKMAGHRRCVSCARKARRDRDAESAETCRWPNWAANAAGRKRKAA